MLDLSYNTIFQVLLLQLASDGRDKLLLGESLEAAKEKCPPFLIGNEFPSVYLEVPLLGDPFLDVTVLYSNIDKGTYVEAPEAASTQNLFDWFASIHQDYDNVSFGFELDTSNPNFSQAGVHFQPRTQNDLVPDFCRNVGEPERAQLYLNQQKRMPEGWDLSFFGMFKGRPNSPLRVCGYLGAQEIKACTEDRAHLIEVFKAVGFSAYTEDMLTEVQEIMALAPGQVDFQFDVFPDGNLGPIFALDVQFEIQQPDKVHASFSSGPAYHILTWLEQKGVVDSRWHLAPDATFARSLPAKRDDGSVGSFAFTLMPQWMKVRWKEGLLQPSKLYYYGNGAMLDSPCL